ncbi:MAG: hypothetical protein LBF83_05700, partial [Spirochaetaceae bacterium]|nr:hypothetical protein [Spirochaetaceae bacterium]
CGLCRWHNRTAASRFAACVANSYGKPTACHDCFASLAMTDRNPPACLRRRLALQSGEIDLLGGDLAAKIPMESIPELKNPPPPPILIFMS